MTKTLSERRQISDRELVAAMLTGPLAWSGFFLAGYLLVEAVCSESLPGQAEQAPTTLALVVLALALVGLAITAYAGVRAYRNWQVLRDPDLLTDSRSEFMAFAAVLLAAAFGLAIILTAIPPLVLSPCPWI